MVFPKPEMSSKLCVPHVKGSAPYQESHPDRSGEGTIYQMTSDSHIILASAAFCKLFCNLADNI